MKILKTLLIVLLVLIAAAAGGGLLLPRDVHVERSVTIAAPRATVFALVNGFRTFNKWSPWYAMDPAAKYEYRGPDSGVGARISWAGSPKTVGSGSQEILESEPLTRVRTRLDFGPEGGAFGQFVIVPEGAGTKLTWSFDTDLGGNPFGRYFGLLFDRMIGKDFEAGLAGLKKFAEELPKADFGDLDVTVLDVAPVTVAYVAATRATDEGAISAAIDSAYGHVTRFLASEGLKQAGPRIMINTRWQGDGYEFDAAIPVDREPAGDPPARSPVRIKRTYAGKAVRATHTGSYQELPRVYEKLFAFLAANGYELNGPPWDEYVSDPDGTPDDRLVTRVCVPVK